VAHLVFYPEPSTARRKAPAEADTISNSSCVPVPFPRPSSIPCVEVGVPQITAAENTAGWQGAMC
jgi:hypothetical protein